jgi:hypothetical protein
MENNLVMQIKKDFNKFEKVLSVVSANSSTKRRFSIVTSLDQDHDLYLDICM